MQAAAPQLMKSIKVPKMLGLNEWLPTPFRFGMPLHQACHGIPKVRKINKASQ